MASSAKTPVLDISKVELHAGFEGRIAARSHLPEPSDAGLNVETPQIFGTVEFNVVERVRARANQAHVTADYVKDLREFINAEFPQPRARRRNPRIVLHLKKGAAALVHRPQALFSLVRISNHGA